jgi:hypothetical protein
MKGPAQPVLHLAVHGAAAVPAGGERVPAGDGPRKE